MAYAPYAGLLGKTVGLWYRTIYTIYILCRLLIITVVYCIFQQELILLCIHNTVTVCVS